MPPRSLELTARAPLIVNPRWAKSEQAAPAVDSPPADAWADRPLRVLLLTDADVFAGTEQHILSLALGLRAHGLHASIACPVPGALATRAQAASVPIVPVQKEGLIDWRAVHTLKALLRTGQFDIIHAHNGRTSLSAALAVRLAHVGHCVITQHFLEPGRLGRSGARAMLSWMAHRWVGRRAHHFIAISDAVRREMLARNDAAPSKITVVPNGVPDAAATVLRPPDDVRRDLGIDPQVPLIVCAARLQPEKDIASLVSAMSMLRGRYPDAVCAIAGEGVEHDALRSQIERSGLSQTVRLLGFRRDVLDIINAADMLVLPSLAEPFGLVLLEAMALSKPIIATAAGGPLEIVADNQTGLLVPPAAPLAICDAIASLLADPPLALRMGKLGRKRFLERFTVERMALATTRIYRQITYAARRT